MNTGIKLYINSINNFRINRVIRTYEAARHAIEDLRVNLIVAEHARRRYKDAIYDSTRLKISIRPGNTPFLASKVYWLRSEEDCAEAVKDLRQELFNLLWHVWVCPEEEAVNTDVCYARATAKNWEKISSNVQYQERREKR